jgi:tRNA (cytidine/uridine-2'-O-)-methyltransferase
LPDRRLPQGFEHATTPMRIALYQPDIPQNTGAIMRLAACLGVPLDLIEPAGFLLGDRRLKRVGMDYLELLDLTRHRSWAAFLEHRRPGRVILLTTRAPLPYHRFVFEPDDILLLGRESAGVPEEVHATADARLRIPLREGARSLNVALATAMVLGEALRQTGRWPEGVSP